MIASIRQAGRCHPRPLDWGRHKRVPVVDSVVGDIPNAVFVTVIAHVIAPVVAYAVKVPLVPTMRIMAIETISQEAIPSDNVVTRICGRNDTVLVFGDDVPLEGVVRRIKQIDRRVRQTDLRVFHATVSNRVEIDSGHASSFDHTIANDEMSRRVINIDAVIRIRRVDSPAFNDIRILGRSASGEDSVFNSKPSVPIDINRLMVPPPKEPTASDLPPHQDDRQYDSKHRHRCSYDLPAHHRLLKKKVQSLYAKRIP